MPKQLYASIVFYNDDTQQMTVCTVNRRDVQAVIDRELTRTGGIRIPPDAPDHSTMPLTDEHGRKLGGMVMLMQAYAHPELRERLQITTETPMKWTVDPPLGSE
ncbi:hypothetical protein [Paraburkholderia diazotrophica]|uniref:Uncharacterized protein n=1 Tax=Paraburkholderia diazotrophica TaxID=667676 RepID=A0A1H7E980_9BURK|nr:hypothetical protein [Paraburkholderia diazotrophica]SEK10476.1 hypothetical protein SAMN05192539_104816 [Paraburkholderia diazotrophica]